ncbi:MAG: TIGR01212 family radical SAM protein [Clostridia bacterium]|nr:TIGR01212 family radical SAM protein [Clostridia bacterium]
MRGKYKPKQIKRFYSFSDYLINTFGKKVYKISLSAGFSCPNRDGKISTRGCIFCSEGGSGDFSCNILQGIDDAIENAKLKVKNKTNEDSFIAYFQSFSNTYAPLDKLKEIYTPIMKRKDIVALAIATRPDCLQDEIIDFLCELNKIKPIIIELGLQTIHESTAELINRGYSLPVFEEAILKLKKANLHTVVHLIIGLPGENQEMIFQTADYIAKSNVDGIKLHLLHVLKNTKLEQMYQEGQFKTLEKQEYIEIIANIIERMPQKMVIHRLTGDAPKKLLVSPQWSANKKDVLNSITKYFNEKDILQGKNYNN